MDRSGELLQDLLGKLRFYDATLRRACGASMVEFTRGANGEFFVIIHWEDKKTKMPMSFKQHFSRTYVFGTGEERRGCALLFIREMIAEVLNIRGVT